jgi:hypothetical protein
VDGWHGTTIMGNLANENEATLAAFAASAALHHFAVDVRDGWFVVVECDMHGDPVRDARVNVPDWASHA